MKNWDLPTTEKDAIEFLQNRGLHTARKCRNNHEMKLYHAERPFWKCNKCNQKMGLRSGKDTKQMRLRKRDLNILKLIIGNHKMRA